MPSELVDPQALASSLIAEEPTRYYAVWQFPEGRYAYMIGFRSEAWLIAMDSQAAGEAYLASDAQMNGRLISAYRLDELTLTDVFAAARSQPVPFQPSQGLLVRTVLGVEIRTRAFVGTQPVCHLPL